jgi:membrane glycosyltransferase
MGSIDMPRSFVAIRTKNGYGFLPAENPLPMVPSQFWSTVPAGRAPDKRISMMPLRRAYIFGGTAAMTLAGGYEMYEVLQIGGITILEGLVLGLFVLLFAWIAFSFVSSLAGFAVLLLRNREMLQIDTSEPLPTVVSRIEHDRSRNLDCRGSKLPTDAPELPRRTVVLSPSSRQCRAEIRQHR